MRIYLKTKFPQDYGIDEHWTPMIEEHTLSQQLQAQHNDFEHLFNKWFSRQTDFDTPPNEQRYLFAETKTEDRQMILQLSYQYYITQNQLQPTPISTQDYFTQISHWKPLELWHRYHISKRLKERPQLACHIPQEHHPLLKASTKDQVGGGN